VLRCSHTSQNEEGFEKRLTHKHDLQEQFRAYFSPKPGSSAASPAPKPQYQHQDSFDFIAGSMRKCLNHLGPWSIGDLAFGLYAPPPPPPSTLYLQPIQSTSN